MQTFILIFVVLVAIVVALAVKFGVRQEPIPLLPRYSLVMDVVDCCESYRNDRIKNGKLGLFKRLYLDSCGENCGCFRCLFCPILFLRNTNRDKMHCCVASLIDPSIECQRLVKCGCDGCSQGIVDGCPFYFLRCLNPEIYSLPGFNPDITLEEYVGIYQNYKSRRNLVKRAR